LFKKEVILLPDIHRHVPIFTNGIRDIQQITESIDKRMHERPYLITDGAAVGAEDLPDFMFAVRVQS
jgi:hypothetical protein